MSHLSILRIGPFPDDNECAAKLRNVLVTYFQQTTTSQRSVVASHDSPQLGQSPTAQNQISISNRYFTAEVLFAEIGVESSSCLTGNVDAETKALSEDGLILIFDAELSHPKFATSMSASFDTMESIHDRAVDKGTAGDLLRLCVGIGNSRIARNASSSADTSLSEKEYEQEYSRRVLWCLDRGYEYVELLDLSEESIRRGHDVRDKEGFARIVEAISGTVWTSVVMEPKAQIKLHESYVESRSSVLTSDFTPDAEGETPNDARLNLYQPPDPKIILSDLADSDETDQEREEKARLALLAGASDEVDTGTEQADNGSSDFPAQKKEMEEERSLNALESSLREARRIRELSKSGELSDEERRQRAADAAMVIMNAMEKMGMYDDDEDDDEDSEGDVDSTEKINGFDTKK
jgi:Alpha and gamma adaptin binding protein p34